MSKGRLKHEMLNKDLTQEEAWKIMQPVCRELFELTNAGYLQFVSGSYNESDGSYKINLNSSHIHLASRGFKDSIGDVEYSQGKMRIGLRANGIPVNIFVNLI
ncbi:MAG: hypothetical protein WAM14_09830 [Candidatus Nitrosopolaris sp.]